MSMLGTKNAHCKDGRTKEAFKDETDINKILKRAQKTGTISHMNRHQGRYADFSGFDFFEAQLKLTAGREIFDELPSEIRNEFNQNPARFFAFVNDPENKDRLAELLPALAEPGRQNLDVGNVPADELKAREAAQKIAVGEGTDVPANEAPAGTEEPAKAPNDPSGA